MAVPDDDTIRGPWERFQPEPEGPWARYQTQPPDAGRRGFFPFLNQGIVAGLGAPVDLVNWGLGSIGVPVSDSPVGGSAWLGGLLDTAGQAAPRAIGGGRDMLPAAGAVPETLGERMGSGAGLALGWLPTMGAGVGALAARGGPVVSGAARTLAEPFLAAPGAAIATEALAGAGTGLGEHVAEALYPGSTAARATGQLVGGLGLGLAPSAIRAASPYVPGAAIAANTAREIGSAVAPFTGYGAANIASQRLRNMAEDPGAALEGLRGDYLSDLSPAARTGDARLMGLEQAVRRADPQADATMRRAEEAAAQDLAREAGGIGGSPQQARAFFRQRLDNVLEALGARRSAADAEMQDAVQGLQPGMDRGAASTVFRGELEQARAAARQDERALWRAVPEDVQVPTDNARQVYERLSGSLARARQSHMPEEATRFLARETGEFGPTESAREVHGLYSELRRIEREARSGATPNHQRASLAREIADALLHDMDQAAVVGGPMRDALDATRAFYARFGQGAPGRVLGSERTGGERVADELTLPTTIGRSGPSGGVAQDQLVAALGDVTPDARQALDDFLMGQFLQRAERGGTLSPSGGEAFMRSNEPVMSRNPEVRSTIEDALSTTERAQRASDTAASRARAVERDATANVVLNTRYGDEFSGVLRAQDPQGTAAQLARQARHDTTGAAEQGLRGSVAQDFLNSAFASGGLDSSGSRIMSGDAASRWLADPQIRAAASEILSPDEMTRLERVADEMRRIERIGSARAPGELIDTEANTMIAFALGTLASRGGARLGAGVSGASLRTSSMAAQWTNRVMRRLTQDKAAELVIRAVTEDRALFDALLSTPESLTRAQRTRILEALAGTGASTAHNVRSTRDDD